MGVGGCIWGQKLFLKHPNMGLLHVVTPCMYLPLPASPKDHPVMPWPWRRELSLYSVSQWSGCLRLVGPGGRSYTLISRSPWMWGELQQMKTTPCVDLPSRYFVHLLVFSIFVSAKFLPDVAPGLTLKVRPFPFTYRRGRNCALFTWTLGIQS